MSAPLRDDLAWQDKAKCLDVPPETFFPEAGKPNKRAKLICNSCPVKQECLEYALELVGFEVTGVWGGMSQREREALRRKRRNLGQMKVSA